VLLPDPQPCKIDAEPSPNLRGAVGSIHDGYVVICGGLEGAPIKWLPDCKRMSLYDNKWEEDAALPHPAAFGSMVMVPKWGMWIMGGLPADSMV